mgnify:CR=1 FL=1
MSANDIEYKNIDFKFHLRSCLSKTLSCYIELSAHLLHSGWSLCVLQEVGWPDTALSHMTTNKLEEKKIIPVTELEWTTTKNWGKRDGQQQSRNPTALGSWKGCCRESFCCQKAWVYLKHSLHIHALFFWFSPLNSSLDSEVNGSSSSDDFHVDICVVKPRASVLSSCCTPWYHCLISSSPHTSYLVRLNDMCLH